MVSRPSTGSVEAESSLSTYMAKKTHESIPVYHPDGRLWRWLTAAELFLMKNVQLKANKRGYVHRAVLTGNEEMRPISQGNAGQAFEEELSCGRVWSLKMAPAQR